MVKTLTDWLSYLEQQPLFFDNEEGPNRVRQVIQQLGLKFNSAIVTVGGTNGKGSTTALLEQIYLAQGYTTASFTSPHLFRFNERIKINNECISDKELCDAFEKISQSTTVSLRYFDYVFLVALIVFSNYPVDIILLEVGLGGRLDATNAIDADVAIITSIDLDHCDRLGSTREAIAYEKAGIFRHNQSIICGDKAPPANLIKLATEVSSSVYQFQQTFALITHGKESTFISNDKQINSLPSPNVIDSNLACALQTLMVLASCLPYEISKLKHALAQFTQLGRRQVVSYRNQPFILDVAHNPAAVIVLLEFIKHQYPDRPIRVLFGCHHDKAIKDCLSPLQAITEHWHIVNLNSARGASIDLIEQSIESLSIASSTYYSSVSFALEELSHQVNDSIVVCYGSFEVISQVLSEMEG